MDGGRTETMSDEQVERARGLVKRAFQEALVRADFDEQRAWWLVSLRMAAEPPLLAAAEVVYRHDVTWRTLVEAATAGDEDEDEED
jgi:hypothetical protein